jgi:hypothetical protein
MGTATKRKTQHHELVDVTKRVVAARYCIRCGTDLRGESIEGVCPECRHPIYDSVYGGYLIDAHPYEPRRLHDRSNMVFYPAIFLAGLGVIALLTTLVTAHTVVDLVYDVFEMGFFLAMLSPLIAFVGIVVFTGRHSVEYYRAKYGKLQYLIGGLLLVAAVVTGAILAISRLGHIAAAFIQVSFFAIPAGIFLERLAALLRRIPNKKLAMYARLALTLSCALSVAALLIKLVRPLAPAGSDLAGFVIAMTLLTDLGGIGLGIATLRLLVLARRALRAIFG